MTVLKARLAQPISHDCGPIACLLLHGFAGSPAEIRPLAQYLADQGITVRAPLLPGHGTDPEDLRKIHWPQWVRAAEAEYTALRERFGQVHVVGFSMGGLLSLYLGAHHEVASLSTLSCPIKLADWRQIFVPLAKHFIRDYPARISNPAIAEQLDSYDRFPVDAIHSLLRLAKQVRKDLHRVTAPLLTVQGERDKWIVPDSDQYIVANVSSASTQSVRLPNRNHLITLEHGRDEVFRAVHGHIMNWRSDE